MMKIISIMGQAMVALGLMAAVPQITATMKGRLADNGKLVDAMAALSDDNTKAIEKIAASSSTGGDGAKLDPTNPLTKLMGLLKKEPGADASKPATPPVPTGPMTVIRYTGNDENGGKSAKSDIRKLPPGANATVIDGQVQIYYPSRKAKTAPANSRAAR